MDVGDCRTVHRLPSSISRRLAERRPGSIGHIKPFAGSVQERVVRESRTLRAMWRGLETDLRCG